MSHGPARPPQVFDRAFLTGVEDVTRLILVRHGEQQPREPGASEATDRPLSEQGRRQARLVGERFSTEHVDVVYSSPLSRALDTAVEIARHHRMQPQVVQDLREIEVFRDLPADRPASDVLSPALLAGLTERMVRERRWDIYPFSEPSFDFRKRVVNAIEAILAESESKSVVVACHGGVINAYVAHIIGVDYDMFFRPAHTSVNVVYSGQGIRALQSLNDVSHLLTPEGSLVSH